MQSQVKSMEKNQVYTVYLTVEVSVGIPSNSHELTQSHDDEKGKHVLHTF